MVLSASATHAMEWPAGRNVISFSFVALEKSIEGEGPFDFSNADAKSCKQGAGLTAEAEGT